MQSLKLILKDNANGFIFLGVISGWLYIMMRTEVRFIQAKAASEIAEAELRATKAVLESDLRAARAEAETARAVAEAEGRVTREFLNIRYADTEAFREWKEAISNKRIKRRKQEHTSLIDV